MENQNPQPDFSFITNQPGVESVKPKHSKKLYILIALAVLLVIMVIVILVFPKKKTSNNNIVSQSRSDIVNSYFSLLNQQKYTDAYALFSDDAKNKLTEDQFTKSAPTFFGNIQLDRCTISADNAQTNSISSTCPTKTGGVILTYEIQLTPITNSFRINEYTIKAN